MTFRVLLFVSILSSALAADSTLVDTTANLPKRVSILPVPIVGYAPETRWVAGAATGIIARIDTLRPSTLVALLTYSQNDQFRVYLNPDMYFGLWHTVGEFEMRRWPDSYWGIGNHTSERDLESYTPRIFGADVSVQKKLTPAFGAGLRYTLKSIRILNVESGRDLDRANLKGTQTVISGPGINVFYDTRDNNFFPERGAYLSGQAGLSGKFFGGSRNYQGCTLDLRGYWTLHGSHILAVQGYGSFDGGNPPFTELPSIGNEYRLRGYSYGRFRDMNVLSAQIEYRFPIFGRIRGGLFAGAGDVSDSISHFSCPNFKHSLGGGLRWMLLPKDKVSLRLDKAWGQHTEAFYLSLNEAF